jgi:hypothetical protein
MRAYSMLAEHSCVPVPYRRCIAHIPVMHLWQRGALLVDIPCLSEMMRGGL